MKVCMLFIIFVPSLSTKEYSEDISHLLHNPDLLLEVVKRLGSNKASPVPRKKSFADERYSGSHVPVHGDLRTCKTHLLTKTIIKTEDSRKQGASFLGSAENVDTNDKCLQKCCSLPGCDLAVYENKTKHNCYMFKCQDDDTGESNCKFDYHADYLSTLLSSFENDIGHTASVADNKDGENEDSLGADLEKVTKQSIPALADTKPPPLPTQLPHSVALGQMCQLDMSCEDPHTVCFEDTCQCQQSYYQKHGFCREVCLRDQVECERRGTARVGPDCIPKSQVCDGMTQCADGSDERECKAASVVEDKQSQAWQPKSQPVPDGDSYHGGTGFDYSHTSNSHQDKQAESREEIGGIGGKQSNSANTETDTLVDNTDGSDVKNKEKVANYKDYSSDVDKELEAMTMTRTDQPIVKPTFLPTKPVILWYGKETKKDDKNHVDEQESKAGGGSGRMQRVDTTVDESSNRRAHGKSRKQDLPSPRGDRPEALPQTTQRVNKQMTNAPLQQTLLKTKPSQDKPFKPPVPSHTIDINSNSNAGSKLGNQNFKRPYQIQSKIRQSPRTQKNNSPLDISSEDYDSSLYGMGQQRPYPMQRPQPSWAKGNFHKYPANSFNHPYLGGYNYDYNDYDPYVPAKGQNYNQHYGNHNPRFPLNSYDGGNWDDRPNQVEGDVLSGTPDNFKIDDKDTSKNTEDRKDLSENIDIGGPSDPVANGNTDNKHVANENTGNKQAVDKNTQSEAPKPMNMNKENKDNSPHKDSAKDKATENISGNSSESVHIEVNTTPQSVQHAEVEVVNKAEETVFLTKEKVIVASPTDNAQGPIVALSLGLAITLMLLVFVGCRLRNVRHRLRKGRPLHSNEADYLINGMYL